MKEEPKGKVMSTPTGIILIKDYILWEKIQEAYPDWIVLASHLTEEDIKFYPNPF